VTSFDDLPSMSFGARPGYEPRQRVEISGVTVDERDALVIAAGGWIVHDRKVSAGRRPGRLMPRVQVFSYYLIRVPANVA
jgi:hypothetical protein